MAATNKYHITITSSSGTYGFIVKKYSARQKPDSLFGSRFSTGDITYSTMNRWQRMAATSWIGGAFQKYLESEVKFKLSKNIDVLTHGSFKLSRKLNARLYNGTSSIKKGIYFNGAHYFAEGQYIKYTTDNFQNVATSKDFGAGKVVSDLEIYDGKLWAAVGTSGVWSHTTADHSTWAEVKDGVATVSADYLCAWGSNLYVTFTNKLEYYNGTTWTVVRNFASGSDSTYYPKKPIPYASVLYIPINTAGSSTGKGQVWYYTGSILDILYSGDDPVGSKMAIYNSLLIFVVYGLEKLIFKQYNGSSVTNLQSLDIDKGTTVYGTGLKYGEGVLYGAGSDKYDDPVEFSIWNNNLMCIISRTVSQNTVLIYDTIGFTEYITLPVGANYSASMWIYNRNLFIGGSDGDIYQLGSGYSSDGFIQSSIWDAGLQDIKKLYADMRLIHETLKSGDSIEIWYRTENESGFQFLGSNSTVGDKETIISFPTGSGTVISKQFEYKIVLKSYDGTTTPEISDVILRYILAPENSQRIFEYTIECMKKMLLLDGSFESRTPGEIVQDLWDLKESSELLTLVDENGISHTVILSDTAPESITPFPGDDNSEKYVYLRLFEM